MATTKQPTQISKLTDDDLRRMVKQDPVRPGPARYRVVVDEVMHLPIWPIIGQLKAVTGQSDPDLWDDSILIQTAREWGITLDAISAAILYYREHQCAIDAWLAENEAAFP